MHYLPVVQHYISWDVVRPGFQNPDPGQEVDLVSSVLASSVSSVPSEAEHGRVRPVPGPSHADMAA